MQKKHWLSVTEQQIGWIKTFCRKQLQNLGKLSLFLKQLFKILEGDRSRRTLPGVPPLKTTVTDQTAWGLWLSLGVNPLCRNAMAESSRLGILKCQRREFTMLGGILEESHREDESPNLDWQSTPKPQLAKTTHVEETWGSWRKPSSSQMKMLEISATTAGGQFESSQVNGHQGDTWQNPEILQHITHGVQDPIKTVSYEKNRKL